METLAQKTITVKQKLYQILHCLGEGSHATVWFARAQFYPHDEITVKVAKAKEGIAHERLQNEIWFLKEISLPHIPPLLDHGTLDGHLWLAMPVFQKLQLSFPGKDQIIQVDVSDIRPQGYPSQASTIPFTYRQKLAVDVLADISKVIAYLAGTGIVHADISPGNIMEKRGSVVSKQYVLTDWGAAALIYRYPSESFGSLHFTAPERLLGQIGHKSDLFSLGVTTFYILTGTVPYGGSSGEEYYLQSVAKDEISPAAFIHEVAPPLDKLIRDLIRHHPEDRPEPMEVCKRIDKIRTG